MQAGDIIKLGKYEWRVLDIENSAALIITENIVVLRAYHNKSGDITWADCELREYLNTEFFNDFTEAEKVKFHPAWQAYRYLLCGKMYTFMVMCHKMYLQILCMPLIN